MSPSAVLASALWLCACSDAPVPSPDVIDEVQGSGPLELSGELDGDDFTRRYGWIMAAVGADSFDLHFQTRGDVLLARTADDNELATPAAGVFRMPIEGPSSGRYLCAGEGTTYSADPEGGAELRLRSLSDLGVCPGTPVGGTLDTCLRSEVAEPCDHGRYLTSTIDGAGFDWSDLVIGYRLHLGDGGAAGLRVRLMNGAAMLLDLQDDRVVGGVLWLSPDDEPAGAAYCVGGGSVTGDLIEGPFRLALDGFSLLGACGERPIDGEIVGTY